MWLKQSTAASCIVGPILDSTGTEYASAVIGDLSISKNGGTLTALASAATLTYIANGMYTLTLTTGNTDTVGRIEISCNKSTYQMPQKNFLVLLASVFDALITNATNSTGGLVAATATVSAAAGYIGSTGAALPVSSGKVAATIAAGDVATDAITAASVKADAVTKIQSGLSTYAGGDTNGTTTLLARLGAPAGASISADIAAVNAKTVNLPTDPADASEIAAQLTAILNAMNAANYAQTRFRLSIPEGVEVPESGTTEYVLGINTYNASSVLTDLDSLPTISAYYVDGTSAAALFGSVSRVGTGLYEVTLSIATDTSANKFVRVVGTGVMSGDSLGMTDYVWIKDDVSPDFSSTDRTKLNAVYSKLPTNNIADQTLLNTAISDVAAQTDQLSFGTYGVLADMRGIANHQTAVDTGTDGVVSFISGAYVMTSGSTVSANIVQVDGENVDHDGNGRLNVAVLSGGEGYFDELRAALTTWLDRIDEPISDPKTLTSDYNAAKTAASQTSLDSLQESVDGLGSGIADDVISGLNTSGVTVTDIGSSALQQLGELGTIRVEQPMVTESTITLRQGDDYLEADSRQLQFLNTQGTWPNLTDAVCVLELVINSEKYTLDPGTVVVAVGVNQRVDIEVPRSITSQLNYSLGRFELTATLSTGSMVTLRVGVLNTILNN